MLITPTPRTLSEAGKKDTLGLLGWFGFGFRTWPFLQWESGSCWLNDVFKLTWGLSFYVLSFVTFTGLRTLISNAELMKFIDSHFYKIFWSKSWDLTWAIWLVWGKAVWTVNSPTALISKVLKHINVLKSLASCCSILWRCNKTAVVPPTSIPIWDTN